MSFNNLPLIGLLQQRMGWLNDRQEILARNIANASTPGFVPQDLRPNDFAAALSGAMAQGVSTTNPLHIRPASAVSQRNNVMAAPDSRASPDGNAVVVEEQMLKMAESRLAYDAAISFYQKSMQMVRLAARPPGR